MKYVTLFLIFTGNVLYSQDNKILERIQALENNGKIWYNIDGCSITSENFEFDFDEKGINKVLRKHSIKESSRNNNENIKTNNFHFIVNKEILPNIFQENSYYLIENERKKITMIWFAKIGGLDKHIQIEVVNMIVENKIPAENFASMSTEIINFGGRQLNLGDSCYWTALNSVQCPYYGQMNWSVHKDFEDAKNSVENQFIITKSQKGGKIILEEIVDIEFEGIDTKAKKVIYDFTGIKGVLAGMSGGKTLTIYYVAQAVRGNYMSCVLSFWNNDSINPNTGLPPLLEEVMKLK